ncbi:MAG: hypothetical protein U0Q11_06405 [Vicinamibacterales bacterium]
MPVLLAMLVVASASLTPRVPVRPSLDLVVELEHGVDLPRQDLDAVSRELTTIWSPLIDLHVILPGDRTRPGADDVVRMTITTRTLDGRESNGLGWIDFLDEVPQPAITISTSALSRLIATGSWNHRAIATLPPHAARMALRHGLARAAAHELGHYLLRSTAHARTGLMRAQFSCDDLFDARAGATRLEPDQIARLTGTDVLIARHNDEPAGVADSR